MPRIFAWMIGLSTLPCAAQDYSFPISVEIAETFYQSFVTCNNSHQDDGLLRMVCEAPIQSIIDDVDGIVRRLRLDFPPGVEQFQSWGYNGTGGAVASNSVWIKYHFRVDPHNAKPTNGSIEAWFRPEVTDGSVRLRVVQSRIHVSNTFVRIFLEESRIMDSFESKLTSACNDALEDRALQLPDILPLLSLNTESAEIYSDGGVGMLRIVAMPVLK